MVTSPPTWEGVAGRARCSSDYTWSAQIEKSLAIFDDVLARFESASTAG